MTQITLLITSGNGPGECQQAVAGVSDVMRCEADAQGIECDVSSTTTKHGMKSAIVVLSGDNARTFVARWRGTVRWRAKSSLRPHHKRANWFIGIFELPQTATEPIEVKTGDVRFESFRAGGPGGQHQNTTDSAVRATHLPTGLCVVAREMRSQHRNKALAIDRLKALMAGKAVSERAAQKGDQNQFHNQLERGNPVRCFKGAAFEEEKS